MDYEKKLVYDVLENHRPELWRRCYPRIYEEPGCGQYYSPKEVAYQLLGTAIRIEQEGIAGQSQMAEIVWASRLANLRVPMYWIGHDMAQAIQQTIPPMWFDWVNTPLPFEAMAFMVPRGILPHETEGEGEAIFVSFVRVKNGDEIPTLSPGGPRTYEIHGDAFSVFVATGRGESLMHWTYSSEHDTGMGQVNLQELDTLVQDFAVHPHSTYSLYSSSLTLEDNRFMARVSHFVFGTLLMMLNKSDLVTPASLRKRVPAKARQAPKEFWSPNVLGLHYKIRRLYIPQGGTHASPRGHWVRGAHKFVAYGEKHALRKPKWIEPYWRGGEVE